MLENYTKNLRSVFTVFAVLGLTAAVFWFGANKSTTNAEAAAAASDLDAPAVVFPGIGVGDIPDGNAGVPPQFGPPRFGFVRRNKHRFSDISQKKRNFFIKRRNSGAGINYPDYCLRLFDGVRGLFKNVRGNNRLIVRHDSARVHERKSFRFPFDFAVNSVARYSRLIADN